LRRGWIPPIIALIGAVFVANLTAVTTNRRQPNSSGRNESA
jgi:hypothetical protein